jgi:hypothetical protein
MCGENQVGILGLRNTASGARQKKGQDKSESRIYVRKFLHRFKLTARYSCSGATLSCLVATPPAVIHVAGSFPNLLQHESGLRVPCSRSGHRPHTQQAQLKLADDRRRCVTSLMELIRIT